jgi:2-hydroxychromene-2-carboxylate isomerase
VVSIEFYFDCSSPWTYLGFERIQPLAAELGAEIAWKPILVGGVFNAVNQSVYHERDNPVPAKAAYQAKDMADWARHVGITIVWRPTVFPVNAVKAMRACLAAEDEGRLVDFARATFEAYWGRDQDISQADVLGAIADRLGLDAEALMSRVATPEIKERLRHNTEEVIRRGGFGSPTMFVGDDMFFGNDRLPLVRDAVERAKAGR